MEIKINIQKKDLFLISAIIVFFVGVGIIIAYNPGGTGGNPAVMGHDVSELDWSKPINGNLNVNGIISATTNMQINSKDVATKEYVDGKPAVKSTLLCITTLAPCSAEYVTTGRICAVQNGPCTQYCCKIV